MKIALTGHRSEDCEDEATVRERVRNAIEEFGPPEDTVVLCGMANGFDLWAGSEVLLLGYRVWACRPWKGHKPRAQDRELYARVIEGASQVVNVSESEQYLGPWLYHARNEYMVNNADRVLAYWSGKESGGTYACIQFAEKQKVKVTNIYG